MEWVKLGLVGVIADIDVRKRAEELATMERMESFGLAPAVDCEGLPWDMADALPERISTRSINAVGMLEISVKLLLPLYDCG